jgi:hypothetical protein
MFLTEILLFPSLFIVETYLMEGRGAAKEPMAN